MISIRKNFDFNLRRDHQKKNSYERRDYESVDEKSLSYIGYVPKNHEQKNNSGSKGLTPTDGCCWVAD